MKEVKARTMLRTFIRQIVKKGRTTTANGKANLYAGHTRLALQLHADGSYRMIHLPYKRIRAAINLMYYARTITRRDLEPLASGKESALLGVLIEIFGTSAKIVRTPTGFIRLTLKGIRYFFAGADRAVRDLEIAAANGAQFVLMSYAHLRSRSAWRGHVERLGLKILLDSGAFTVWQAQQKGKSMELIHVSEYARFIQEHRLVLYGWFNLDVIGDAAASKQNAKYLADMGLQPVEVWHVGESMEDLAQMVREEHPVIAIGGSVGLSEKARAAIFSEIFEHFPEQNFHFLGGSSKLLQRFPWFSADSTGWLAGRRYGGLIDSTGQHRAPAGMDGVEAMAANVSYLVSLS